MPESIFLQGPAGKIEVFVDHPKDDIRAVAVVCHPHPLQGGNAQHKIPMLLSNVLTERGCLVYRPSFRGAGLTEGPHEEGFGETNDILAVISQLRAQFPQLPFYAGGFSFGAHVLAKCYAALTDLERPTQMILCGLPTANVRGLRHYETPEINGDLLFVHGEEDDITLLSDVVIWAKPQKHPITIFPGANHFFTGYLKPLRHVINQYLTL
ncbi:hydrolase [Acinetobacter sp. MD2(2019)]|uniref:alpha/beta hydrolase n=1 Tax=Acinetobacter sp. MD2(2019) TaxID=2605273 RepID=UPI002D1F65B3|nr:hydrolase [Acinetobacter sp. MD2(2019)]MEB3754094.1 hydrolase [Acinetobacter sp. MD2(2019)]